MMNETTVSDCRLYSDGFRGFDDVTCRSPVYSDMSAAGYAPVYPPGDLYEPRSRCRDELIGRRSTDYGQVVSASPYFGRQSATELAYPGYSTPSALHGDCCVFQSSYGSGQMDFTSCSSATAEQRGLCAEDGHRQQSSTVDDSVSRPCRTLEARQTPTIQHQEQQQHMTRPVTYKWMTVKRGPAKTAAGEAEFLSKSREIFRRHR